MIIGRSVMSLPHISDRWGHLFGQLEEIWVRTFGRHIIVEPVVLSMYLCQNRARKTSLIGGALDTGYALEIVSAYSLIGDQ